jgi:hypothetical protein
LIFINLLSFDGYQLVADVLSQIEPDMGLQKMGDGLVVVCLEEVQDVRPSYIKIFVKGDSYLKLVVLALLCDGPCIVDELSSITELRVHYKRHEVVLLDHPEENFL